jgi:hypothetical protein
LFFFGFPADFARLYSPVSQIFIAALCLPHLMATLIDTQALCTDKMTG